MSREFDDAAHEPRDYTKYIWVGVGLLVLVMIGLMLFAGESVPRRSEVKTRHILIKFDKGDPADQARALALIKEIREKIVSGEATFSEMAEKYSDDPTSASRGGFLGTHGKGDMQEQYENYSWSAPLKQLSGIIQTTFGYHLMIVDDRYISPADEYEKKLEEKIRAEQSKAETPPAEDATQP